MPVFEKPETPHSVECEGVQYDAITDYASNEVHNRLFIAADDSAAPRFIHVTGIIGRIRDDGLSTIVVDAMQTGGDANSAQELSHDLPFSSIEELLGSPEYPLEVERLALQAVHAYHDKAAHQSLKGVTS